MCGVATLLQVLQEMEQEYINEQIRKQKKKREESGLGPAGGVQCRHTVSSAVAEAAGEKQE